MLFILDCILSMLLLLQVEEEFRKLSEESEKKAPENVVQQPSSATEPAKPKTKGTREDIQGAVDLNCDKKSSTATTNTVPFIDDEQELTDTPRRPKPTSLDLPGVKRSIGGSEEVSSPETPSYSSRPLPSSPRGPAFTDIALR